MADKQKYDDFDFNAKIHGVKLKPQLEKLDVKEDDRKEFNKQADDALSRLKQRYVLKKVKDGSTRITD